MSGSTPFRRDMTAGLLLVALGIAFLILAANRETATKAEVSYSAGAVGLNFEAPITPAYPLKARSLGPIVDPATAALLGESEREAMDGSILFRGYSVYLAEIPPEIIKDMLASGRAPDPGAAEVVAGPLAADGPITIDDQQFDVVGILDRRTSGLVAAYILPNHPTWAPLFSNDQVQEGWYATSVLDDAGPEELADQAQESNGMIIGGNYPATPFAMVMASLGLALVAVGGALFQVRLLQVANRRWRTIFSPIIDAFAQHPVLFIGTHSALYGLLIAMTAAAAGNPLLNLGVVELFSYQFQEGGLQHVAAAYESGNVPMAALYTWAFNYFFATLLMSVFPSLIVPGWAFLKNAATFALVGFGLAPIWPQTIDQFSWHSITMTLELEAYVIVSFAAIMVPVKALQGLQRNEFANGLLDGYRILASAALLAGVLLAVAGLYEAVSLILFVDR